MSLILIAEDQDSVREGLKNALGESGHSVTGINDGLKALDELKGKTYDILITDIRMPGMDGMELLKAAKKLNPDTYVIVITAFGSVETAVAAMKAGAYDYINKPFSIDEMELLIKSIEDKRRVVEEREFLREEIKTQYNRHIIGNSPMMKEIYATVDKVANSDSAVLIRGESGTGKELIAGAIHYKSARRDKLLVRVSCAALSESLLESELFGHEKGAFTGAISRRKGRFELADGGTLFLDDIGDISPSIQVKLLRVLQEKEFERVGGTETLKVDVRIVSATHKDLEEAIKRGEFREDLYYRLNVVFIYLPPLRERKEDIPLLANFFLTKYGRKSNSSMKKLIPQSNEALMSYNWRGNVRELENVIERAVVLVGDEEEVGPEHLLLPVSNPKPMKIIEVKEAPLEIMPKGMDLRSMLQDWEKEQLIDILNRTDWVQTKAAKVLGIPRTSLRYKMKKLGIESK